ncbi:MAG: methyltransferase domain-containing protein [Opitutales bacterium]|nr:methyltransferase domain-containing protein [Opitutales bacterium]
MKPEEWSQRYREGRTGWDIGGSPPELAPFIASLPPARSVLIPGCGKGHEVAAFREAGHRVVAVDYAEGAVEAARQNLGKHAECVRLADFFDESALPAASFDICYERTFLCAIPVARRSDYTRRVRSLLRPGGRLAGLFLYGDPDPDGPPFPLLDDERKSLLGAHFNLLESRPTGSEFQPLPEAREYWEVWKNPGP